MPDDRDPTQIAVPRQHIVACPASKINRPELDRSSVRSSRRKSPSLAKVGSSHDHREGSLTGSTFRQELQEIGLNALERQGLWRGIDHGPGHFWG